MKPGEIARSVTRGTFYLAIEKSAALMSGIAYFALLLRWLGPTKYGIITLALSFAGLATNVTGNFEVFLERYAAEYQAQGRLRTLRRALGLALGLKLALGALASVALVALAPFLARQFGIPELATLLPLLALLVACDGLATTGRATLYGLQQFRWVSGLALLFHVAKTIMVGLMWWTRQGLPQLAIGLSLLALATGALTSLVPIWMLRHGRDPQSEPAEPGVRGLFHAMIAYCSPLLGARLTFSSGQNLGKIVLGKMFTATELGYFTFAYQTVERFVELVHTLPSALLPPLTQLVALQERERLRAVFDRSLRLVQVVACALSFALFAFAPEITLLVGSPLFRPAIPLLRVMALVPMARTAQQPLTMLFYALRRPGTVLVLALVKFVVEFGSYFALIPWLGTGGAAWSNAAGAVVSYVAALMLLANMVPEGAGERVRSGIRAVLLLLPMLVATLACDRLPGEAWSFAGRVLLAPIALIGVIGLGLVNRHDLDRLETIPLRIPWMRGVRDRVVRQAGRFVRTFEPRRIP